MVLGWRKAFCTSISKNQEPIIKEKKSEPSPSPSPSPKLSSRLTGFFSNSTTATTPRSNSLRCRTVATQSSELVYSNSAPQSPTLKCRTRTGSRFFQSSPVSSPRSPSTFSLFKSRKSRCGVCYQTVKPGQGTAVFTAECGHNFHYPCISSHVLHTCPICNYTWKQQIHLFNNQLPKKSNLGDNVDKRTVVLKVYNDDEPLTLPVTGSPFNPIPENDETDEFPGFSTHEQKPRTMDISILPDTAIVSVSKVTETYAIVLSIKAPTTLLRKTPIDLVAVLNVNRNVVTAEKMGFLKKAMRSVVSSLSVNDRLSIVAYASTSKRIFPLRRMTVSGKRAARKVIDAIAVVDGGGAAASAGDSLKKAVKVLEDRREVNSASGILLFADGVDNQVVSSTRLSEISVYCVSLSACVNAPADDDTIGKWISPLLNVVIQDLRIRVGFECGSGYGEISAVYTCGSGPAFLGSGSSMCHVGDLYSEEKRELLLELKVPFASSGARKMVSIRCSYIDPSTQQPVFDEERLLHVPTPRAVGSSSTYETQRLRCLFVTTRAVVDSRRMREKGDLSGAQRMLGSARALVMQSGSGLSEKFVLGLEAELTDLNRRRQDQLPRVQVRSRSQCEKEAEPLTPASAWRAAERLAKVAIMRRSLNRVSDLHGFENARF